MREELLTFGALLLFFLVVSVLAMLFLQSERGRNTLLAQYEADRDASALFEVYRSDRAGGFGSGSAFETALPSGIAAFGIYGGDGGLIAGAGDVPSAVAVTPGAVTDDRFSFDSHAGTITLVRPLGVFPSAPGRFPRFGSGAPRAGRGGFGRPDAPPGPSGDMSGMMGQMGGLGAAGMRGLPAYLYLRKDIRSYYAAQSLLDVASAALPLILAGALLFVGRLYAKNRSYRRKIASQANLVHLGEIARTLSHEIKNPLGSIKLQTGILKRVLQGDPPRELALIEEETDQLNRLVERIGEFLRDPVGAPAPLQLEAFVEKLTARFDWKIERRAFGPEAHWVLFDPDRLRSVLENLLKNAVESGGEKGLVRLELDGTKSRVEVRVIDHGPGLPNGGDEVIFDPFYTTKTKGSGIGLAISKRFVEASGGTLVLRNGREGGAEACINLPRISGAGAQPNA